MTNALDFLPHGPEFRFIDNVTSLSPGKEGVGEYTVRGDEPFLRGHFPGNPIFPGVLMAEAAAQLAGVVAQSDPAIPPLPGLKLAALRNVKITGTAKPGEVLQIEARVIGRLGNLIQAETRALVNGNIVMTAQLTLSGEAANP
jgi:3-hydroxyacyl-[acyl-carrier-protein] dehydratase